MNGLVFNKGELFGSTLASSPDDENLLFVGSSTDGTGGWVEGAVYMFNVQQVVEAANSENT